jgi:hypothetical protein
LNLSSDPDLDQTIGKVISVWLSPNEVLFQMFKSRVVLALHVIAYVVVPVGPDIGRIIPPFWRRPTVIVAIEFPHGL